MDGEQLMFVGASTAAQLEAAGLLLLRDRDALREIIAACRIAACQGAHVAGRRCGCRGRHTDTTPPAAALQIAGGDVTLLTARGLHQRVAIAARADRDVLIRPELRDFRCAWIRA